MSSPIHFLTDQERAQIRSHAWRNLGWAALKGLAGFAALFGSIHLIDVGWRGALPPVYNIAVLATGLVLFMMCIFVGFRDFKLGLANFKKSRKSDNSPVDTPQIPVEDDDFALRVLGPWDAAAIFERIDENREFLGEWLTSDTFVSSPDEAFQGLRAQHEAYRRGLVIPAGIRVDGQLAGVVGLASVDQSRRSAQLYYWLGESFQGRGLVTRSCRALIDHGFDELNLLRIAIRCEPDNERSRAVAERLDFTYEGTQRKGERKGDEFIDLRIYSMLKGEWKDRESTASSEEGPISDDGTTAVIEQ